ncbi:heavy metal sensor histidine kinase [Erwinia mallotivora]|uniref:Sensor protein n=1 Tax=Erwinia mallotivora TaxID=69222 RepID=A0A014NJE7_9GAMM|nr:heavy metal sensor histidine kinase [Erwinia mallotivora]EXU73930.1 histidine kinase [Erwinia mallotivora]
MMAAKSSISARLAVMFAIAVIVTGTISALLLRSSLHETLRKQMNNELQFRHSLMEQWMSATTSNDQWHALSARFSRLSGVESGRVHYWVLSNEKQFQLGGPPPAGVRWQTLPGGVSKVTGAGKDACYLYLLATDIPASEQRPALRYVVAIDSTPYIGTLNEFSRALVLITVTGAIAVALLGFGIARFGLRPVRHLSKQAHHLAPGNYGNRLETLALSQELQTLAMAFNGVLERQEIAWRQLESFNADVAHELRTPLTNLIGQTQLGLSRERNKDELQELLASNLEELERMTSIVNDMLFLSHAQAGEHATQLAAVSLREETLKTAEYVEPSFAASQLSIAVEGDVTARIDKRLFHRSLANLLENSARYAFHHSTVTVTLSQQNGMARVAVANHGEPIAADHLQRLFERFYRTDASRSHSNTHHGLGLSIVRAVALMHRGDVFASSREGINTFGLTLAMGISPARHPATSPDIQQTGQSITG